MTVVALFSDESTKLHEVGQVTMFPHQEFEVEYKGKVGPTSSGMYHVRMPSTRGYFLTPAEFKAKFSPVN